MFRIFKKESTNICSPVKGTCIPITEVKDQVFSSKMMGDGFAVIPEKNVVCSPIDGEITMAADTKHAVGMRRKDGLEILLHVGLDTVNLNGQGLKLLVKSGARVKAGDALIEYDAEYMEKQGIDMTTMVIFTSGFDQEVHLKQYGQTVETGEVLME